MSFFRRSSTPLFSCSRLIDSKLFTVFVKDSVYGLFILIFSPFVSHFSVFLLRALKQWSVWLFSFYLAQAYFVIVPLLRFRSWSPFFFALSIFDPMYILHICVLLLLLGGFFSRFHSRDIVYHCLSGHSVHW